MNLNELVQNQADRKGPPRILMHSKHGLGKSSWAAVSPSPIFLQIENGLSEIDVPSSPLLENTEEVFQWIEMLIKDEHSYKTCVIDTLDWFEKLVWDEVCKKKDVGNISEIGYQKGFDFAMDYHNKLITSLERLRAERSMAFILLAHNEVRSFNNPEGENYDQYIIKLHKKAAAKYEEACDAVLFMNHKAYVTKEKGKLKAKVIGSGERSIFTEPRPAFSAKCRYDIPFEIPCPKGTGFTDFLKSIKKNGGK